VIRKAAIKIPIYTIILSLSVLISCKSGVESSNAAAQELRAGPDDDKKKAEDLVGLATAPMIDKVQREVSIILRDVGDEEEMGMLLSLLQERMKLRGGLNETVPTQHLVIREDDELRIRVGFDG